MDGFSKVGNTLEPDSLRTPALVFYLYPEPTAASSLHPRFCYRSDNADFAILVRSDFRDGYNYGAIYISKRQMVK